MIVSHDKQFIFVKNRKTGGTSIELALSRHAGPLDITTRFGPEDEAVRLAEGRFPRNFESVEALRPEGAFAEPEDAQAFIKANRQDHVVRQSFFNHMPAVQIRDAVGPVLWNRYFTFCLERIPYDRLLSSFFFRKARRKRLADVSFSEYIRDDDPTLDNWKMYCDDDGVIVDRIIPYHRLREELFPLLDELGAPPERPLPRAKGQYRKDRRHWSEVISADDRTYIDERHAAEFEAMQMTPDAAWAYEV